MIKCLAKGHKPGYKPTHFTCQSDALATKLTRPHCKMWTRPDITYAVSNEAKFCSRPLKQHWTAVERILHYLKGALDFGLCYNKDVNAECVECSDSDWAGDLDDRRSTSGCVFQISWAVSWRSEKQTCVSLSTAEGE